MTSTSELKEDGMCENGECDQQCYECRLNLRGITDFGYSRIFASELVLGVIVGVGNTGKYLNNDKNNTQTFISVDNGQSWEKIFDREMLYAVGNHGGLLVMGEKNQLDNGIYFSWDLGKTHNRFTFDEKDNKPIQLIQITTEPTEMGQLFTVIGHDDEYTYLYTIDFEKLHQKVCYGIWKPNADDSDFRLYEPHSLL